MQYYINNYDVSHYRRDGYKMGGDAMKTDNSNLILEMGKKGITCPEIAFLLEEDEKEAAAKLEGKQDWTYGEAVAIRDVLFPEHDLSYLFPQKDD